VALAPTPPSGFSRPVGYNHSVIDAHVHLFPDRLFDAIWRWFDQHAWTIRYKVYADEVIDHLEAANNDFVVALQYAHNPGMAEDLNAWMGELARRRPVVIPCATVHPHDDDLLGILRRAKETHGARLVKQHCHVLGIAPDDPVMFPLYEACVTLQLPLNLHVGNGPKLVGYGSPTDEVSGARRTQVVLERFPELRLVVPHLGCMEESTFIGWLDRYPNLYLDTSMAMVPFIEGMEISGREALADHANRVMFGTDFPNIPFELGAERAAVQALGFDDNTLQAIFHDTAAALFLAR
jgi:uncharacterized protein